MNLGKKIKQVREHKSWSQRRFAVETDISHVTISLLERGHFIQIRMSTIQKLVYVLKLNPNEILKLMYF